MLTGVVRKARRPDQESQRSRRVLSWGDIVPLLLILALALGWYCDIRHLNHQIWRIEPDQDADWSLRLEK